MTPCGLSSPRGPCPSPVQPLLLALVHWSPGPEWLPGSPHHRVGGGGGRAPTLLGVELSAELYSLGIISTSRPFSSPHTAPLLFLSF